MYRLAFLLMLAAAPLAAQSFDPSRKVDGHVGYNAGLTADLPQGDGNRLKLWVVLSPNWRSNPHEYAIAQMFTSGPGRLSPDPRIRQIQEGCEWNYYMTTSAHFKESKLIGVVGTATPIVCLTGPDGCLDDGKGHVGAYLNARTCPKKTGEVADLLVMAANNLNPLPPHIDDLPKQSGVVFESDCPDGTCEPVPAITQTPVPVEGTLQPVVPRRPITDFPAALIGLGIVGAVGIGWGIRSGKITLPAALTDSFSDRL